MLPPCAYEHANTLVSLRRDSRKLKKLREKLFILWGNLEELKSEGTILPLAPKDSKFLSNKPFQCCIEEYGYFDPRVHKSEDECQRLHRMAGTTIMEDTS